MMRLGVTKASDANACIALSRAASSLRRSMASAVATMLVGVPITFRLAHRHRRFTPHSQRQGLQQLFANLGDTHVPAYRLRNAQLHKSLGLSHRSVVNWELQMEQANRRYGFRCNASARATSRQVDVSRAVVCWSASFLCHEPGADVVQPDSPMATATIMASGLMPWPPKCCLAWHRTRIIDSVIRFAVRLSPT